MNGFRVAAAILLLAASSAEAQRNCKKGIPCGGTCIAANKTCRVGAPIAPTNPAVAAIVVQVATPADTIGKWVGSSKGRTYYRAGCPGARTLAPANVIHFKTEPDAMKAGYTHSAQRGC
jgi:hypothetical protein